MRFSQRIGSQPIKTELEREGLSGELRNSLWTLVIESIINCLDNRPKYDMYRKTEPSELLIFFRNLWVDFFRYPIDNLPTFIDEVNKQPAVLKVRNWYYDAQWDEVFDFIEFCSSYNDNFKEKCNFYLKREMSAYRFVNGILVEVNSEEEVKEIEDAINNSDEFKSVKEHLKRAIELYSDRNNPDYRNSIKESISAVESLCKIIINNDKTTLGQALKVIENTHQIPGSLKSAFTTLYGYTSDEGGIRHSLLKENAKVEIEEARFMLIACSAFVNYLINKL